MRLSGIFMTNEVYARVAAWSLPAQVPRGYRAMSSWKIDPSHTDVAFSAKHLMVTTVRGKFDTVEGELELDEQDPTNSAGEIRLLTSSLSTGVEQRDNHLRSADFFDAEHNPWIVVKSRSIERSGEDRYKVTVDVTIRDTTKSIVFDTQFLGFYPAMDGHRRAGFEMETKVNRHNWGVSWNVALETGGWLVGDEIRLAIDVAADEVPLEAS